MSLWAPGMRKSMTEAVSVVLSYASSCCESRGFAGVCNCETLDRPIANYLETILQDNTVPFT